MTQPSPPIKVPDLGEFGLSRNQPLLIVDVDEVLGLFMQGFGDFLVGRGLEMRLDRFALFQNIFRPGESEHLDLAEGKTHFDDFFRYGCGDMTPADGGAEALRALSDHAGIIILSNAPGQARMARARWLARHRMDYPLILNSGPKGPLAAGLSRQVEGPVVFIDDLLSNLNSVAESAPEVHRFQHVADPRLRHMAPADLEAHRRIDHWPDLHQAIHDIVSQA